MSEFWTWLEMLPISGRIGESWWFPLLESIHVLAAMFVVGSIAWVDLRLLGIAASRYPLAQYVRELLIWTWGAFGLSLVTGLGMFMPRAAWYVENRAFQMKVLLLALAAVNMAWFHMWGRRHLSTAAPAAPSSQTRFAGAFSLCIWIGVTLAGRWTGHLL